MKIKEATEILESRIAIIKNNYLRNPTMRVTMWIVTTTRYGTHGYAPVVIMSMTLISMPLATARTADSI